MRRISFEERSTKEKENGESPMQTISVSEELLDKLKVLCREEGHESLEVCLEKAVERQFSDLCRRKAEGIAGRVREGLAERGHTEDEILRDFETFRQRLRQNGSTT